MLKTLSHKFTLFGAALALGASVAAPTIGHAGTEYKSTGKEAKDLVEEVKKSCISGDLGVNFVSQYVSRGYVLENQSVIAQPYADLYFKLFEGDGFINSITLNMGIFASIHEEHTDAGDFGGGSSTTGAWYEFDWYPGISVGFAKNFTLTGTYLQFLYPNDGFPSQQLVQLKLAYNDADLLGAFSLSPYVKAEYFIENPDQAFYYEVGIAPGFEFKPVKVTFPITAGFGSNEFYGEFAGRIDDEEHNGFVSAGINVAYSLGFIPECYGTWTATAGATYYRLGEALDTFNEPNVRDQDHDEFVFSGGLGVAF